MIDSFWLQGMMAGHKNTSTRSRRSRKPTSREDLKKFDKPTLIIPWRRRPDRADRRRRRWHQGDRQDAGHHRLSAGSARRWRSAAISASTWTWSSTTGRRSTRRKPHVMVRPAGGDRRGRAGGSRFRLAALPGWRRKPPSDQCAAVGSDEAGRIPDQYGARRCRR
jgi:hypothetical protein